MTIKDNIFDKIIFDNKLSKNILIFLLFLKYDNYEHIHSYHTITQLLYSFMFGINYSTLDKPPLIWSEKNSEYIKKIIDEGDLDTFIDFISNKYNIVLEISDIFFSNNNILEKYFLLLDHYNLKFDY